MNVSVIMKLPLCVYFKMYFILNYIFSFITKSQEFSSNFMLIKSDFLCTLGHINF